MRSDLGAQSLDYGKERAYRLVLAAMCALLLAFCCAGCGYTIYGRAALPFQSIAINKIVNRTYEPRLEDKMQVALTDELLRSGFLVDVNSGHRINGSITTFALNTLSAKAGVTVEYEVVIKGDFRLIDPSGGSRVLRNQGVFIVSFPSTDTLESVVAQRELAIEKALKDFSSEIVGSIIYDRPEVQGLPRDVK